MAKIVANVFLILFGIIAIISVFIWIASNMKISINSKYNKISSIVIVVIVVIFIILFPILMVKNQMFENFNNSFPPPNFPPPSNPPSSNPPPSNGSSMQSGKGGISSTGTITFNQPFQNTPIVMTQIIGNDNIMGNDNTKTNIYSIQIFNVSNRSFSYAKNMMSNSTSDSGNFTIAKMSPSEKEPFYWIAFE